MIKKAEKGLKTSRNLDLLGQMIKEKGFTKLLDFAEKLSLSRAEFSKLLHYKRIPTDAEVIKIKEELKGVQNLELNVKKWLTAVRISLGRKSKSSKKKDKKKAKNKTEVVKAAIEVDKKKKVRSALVTTPTLVQVLTHLYQLPAVPDGLILHVMQYYKK